MATQTRTAETPRQTEGKSGSLGGLVVLLVILSPVVWFVGDWLLRDPVRLYLFNSSDGAVEFVWPGGALELAPRTWRDNVKIRRFVFQNGFTVSCRTTDGGEVFSVNGIEPGVYVGKVGPSVVYAGEVDYALTPYVSPRTSSGRTLDHDGLFRIQEPGAKRRVLGFSADAPETLKVAKGTYSAAGPLNISSPDATTQHMKDGLNRECQRFRGMLSEARMVRASPAKVRLQQDIRRMEQAIDALEKRIAAVEIGTVVRWEQELAPVREAESALGENMMDANEPLTESDRQYRMSRIADLQTMVEKWKADTKRWKTPPTADELRKVFGPFEAQIAKLKALATVEVGTPGTRVAWEEEVGEGGKDGRLNKILTDAAWALDALRRGRQ